MKRLILFATLFVTGLPMAVSATADGASPQPGAAAQPVLKTTAQKRQWLRQELAKGLTNPQQIRDVEMRLHRMTPKQIDALTEIALAQQLPQDQAAAMLQQAQFELQRAIWLRQMLENDLWWRRYNAVGFMPVIGWLPQGTQLGASAVISPDGRHVRVGATPFFSSIGPVHSYNLNTGQTYRMPQYGYGTPPYMYWPRGGDYRTGQIPNMPRPPKYEPPRVWYDGIRTRKD